MNACCGHGHTAAAYVQFANNRCIRGEEAVKYFNDIASLTFRYKENVMSKTTDQIDIEEDGREASDASRIIINGYDTECIMPKDNEPVLFLVDNDTEHKDFDTWFGYTSNGKWFGVAEDDEGWQEMAGPVLCWVPFPRLSL
jgi:hypothetical protein